MSDTIWAVIITGAVTLICTLISNNRTTDKVQASIEKQQAVMETKMESMEREITEVKEDVREHNHYAKLFSETMPVVREQIKVANHRIEDLERGR